MVWRRQSWWQLASRSCASACATRNHPLHPSSASRIKIRLHPCRSVAQSVIARLSSSRWPSKKWPAPGITTSCTGTLAAAAERGPVDFPDLLLTPGVGLRTVRSLAMVAEVVHGAPYRFADPARFSLAHGGKDRHPYPVPIKVYDQTIA